MDSFVGIPTPADEEISTGNVSQDTRSAARRMWDSFRQVGKNGFIKGALVAAAVVIAGFALVTGVLGAGETIGNLFVNYAPVKTFEDGLAAGISKAIEFFVKSPLGWATLGAGGALGAARETVNFENQESLENRHRIELELVAARAMQQQKSEEKTVEKTTETVQKNTEKTTDKATDAASSTASASTATLAKESIYVPGSEIKEKTFAAYELKRRSELKMFNQQTVA